MDQDATLQDELLRQREAEKQRLGEAIDAFTGEMRAAFEAGVVDEYKAEMKARAFQKVDEGYTGWDHANFYVPSRMSLEADRLLDRLMEPELRLRKDIDLANFTMFDWWRTRRIVEQAGAEAQAEEK